MFYLKTGTYLYYLVVNAETHLVGKGSYPQDDPADVTPYLEALNRDFLYTPNWEAVGALTLLEFREDSNTARYYTPADVFYVFKKQMKADAWQEARRSYPSTSFEYNEMPQGNFPDMTRSFTFERDESGRWSETDIPVQRAMYSSVEENFPQEILKLGSLLREACEDGECSCGGSCGCGEGEPDDTKEGCGCDSAPAESPESNWYDADEGSSSNWYDEDSSREAGEVDLDEDDDDDDDVVEALKKKTQKSRFTDYKRQRKKLRSDPASRRKRQRQQKRQRRKPQHKLKQKRYRKRTKNSPRSRRRSPRKF